MKTLHFVWLICIAGCNAVPALLPPPDDMRIIPGGISDTRPYYGRVQLCAGGAGSGADFLIASCGCGDWRVLVSPDDGSDRTQFAVRFYAAAAYEPTGPVTVFGDEEAGALLGVLDQDVGFVDGRLRIRSRVTPFEAARGENHGESANACALCHTGPDPIYPQFAGHPAFEINPANCLDCHSVN